MTESAPEVSTAAEPPFARLFGRRSTDEDDNQTTSTGAVPESEGYVRAQEHSDIVSTPRLTKSGPAGKSVCRRRVIDDLTNAVLDDSAIVPQRVY